VSDQRPVKLTSWVTPDAYAALERAAARENLSRTDALNRALQVYEVVASLERGETVTYENGTVVRWVR
jgi:hypothetical protein